MAQPQPVVVKMDVEPEQEGPSGGIAYTCGGEWNRMELLPSNELSTDSIILMRKFSCILCYTTSQPRRLRLGKQNQSEGPNSVQRVWLQDHVQAAYKAADSVRS
jgi:hypothetical protein